MAFNTESDIKVPEMVITPAFGGRVTEGCERA
jgi:hypothetical protein